MKIIKLIINAFEAMDERTGSKKPYSYETAPFCGHHYSGFNGRFVCARYHEGDGGKYMYLLWGRVLLATGTDNTAYWNWAFYNIKRKFKPAYLLALDNSLKVQISIIRIGWWKNKTLNGRAASFAGTVMEKCKYITGRIWL